MHNIVNRKSINADMKQFNPGAKEGSFIELTEWTNGDGFDVTIDERTFMLSLDELDAINYLVMCMRYDR